MGQRRVWGGTGGGNSGGGEVKRVRAAFPITPIRLRSDTQEGISAGVTGMTVSGVADVSPGGSGASDWDDL